MPLPRRETLNDMGAPRKSDEIKKIAAELERAKQKLIAAQGSMNETLIKRLQQIVADLTGTIERNSEKEFKMLTVRTIKPTDMWIFPSANDAVIADNRHHVESALASLSAQQKSLNERLEAELASPAPDMLLVAKLREILRNITQTLNNSRQR